MPLTASCHRSRRTARSSALAGRIPAGDAGGGVLAVGVLQWYFMPNSAGVTAPAQTLLDALNAATIPVFIFLDDAGSSVPCDRLPEICRVPLDSPPDA